MQWISEPCNERSGACRDIPKKAVKISPLLWDVVSLWPAGLSLISASASRHIISCHCSSLNESENNCLDQSMATKMDDHSPKVNFRTLLHFHLFG